MRNRPKLVALVLAALVVLGCEPPAAPGAPVGAQQVVCQGVPREACRLAVETVGGQPGAPRGTIARVVVTCTVPVCTEANGETSITIFYVDGRQETSSYGWSSVPAMPAPGVPGNSG